MVEIITWSQEAQQLASFIDCQFRYLFSHLTFLIQTDRSDVCCSIKSIESPQWETCKTWQQAIKLWDLAYQNKTIFLAREEIWNRSALTHRLLTKTPTPHLHLEAPAVPRTLVSVADRSAPLVQMLASGTPTTLLSDSKKRFPSVIVISDSESNGKNDSKGDSDSEIEATDPVKIEKKSTASTSWMTRTGNSLLGRRTTLPRTLTLTSQLRPIFQGRRKHLV